MSSPKVTLDDRRIRAKLHQAVKVAHSSAKKARQHELQRHVRRLKQCAEAERSDLEKELYYLKTLDIHALALRALSTKLVKAKILPKQAQGVDEERFPLLPFALEAKVDPATTETLLSFEHKAHEHICNQVLSSKVLASELTACLASLIPLVTQQKAPKTPVTEPVKSDKEARQVEVAPPEDGYESDDGMGNQENVHMRGDMDTLVASGSDTEDSDDEDTPRKRANTSEEDDEEDAFLPSLHTGFIPGDDWSDAEADYADTGGKGPAKSQRKNRRGQRERRAIWEKKYGRHANHLKLREKEPRKAREHRAPDRPTKRPKPMQASPPRQPRTQDPHPPSSSRVKPAPPPSNAPLHPSWIAKQRAKEAQHAAKPQGTKVVFD